MVNASGLFTDLFDDNEIANGVVGGVAVTDIDDNDDDDPGPLVGIKTVAACVVAFGLNVNVCGSDVLLHLTANFVPVARFSNSMSVASFVSIVVGLFIVFIVLSWIFFAMAVDVPFVSVVVWHTGIVVVFDTWIVLATFAVAKVFGVTKLSASTKRRESVGGAGMANEFYIILKQLHARTHAHNRIS